VELNSSGIGGATIRFMAMSNISYTIQYETNLVGWGWPVGPWFKITDIAPRPGTKSG